MGCHIEIPQPGLQVTICGDTFASPMLCKFCSNYGLYLCDWKEVERVENTHWHDVRIGDVWMYLPSHPAMVVNIETEDYGLCFCLDIGNGRRVRPFRFFNSTLTCPIFRRGTCDQPVCESHAREVGDHVHYCMDCWQRQAALIGGGR